jgi:hypothetical protein
MAHRTARWSAGPSPPQRVRVGIALAHGHHFFHPERELDMGVLGHEGHPPGRLAAAERAQVVAADRHPAAEGGENPRLARMRVLFQPRWGRSIAVKRPSSNTVSMSRRTSGRQA